MGLLYLSHPSFLEHDTGAWHPERPARLEAAARGVAATGVEVTEVEAPRVDREALELVHTPTYIEAIRRFCRSGGGALDPDTVASAGSWEAALRAAGAGPEAVRLLEKGPSGTTALLAVRPPGHHALADRAMGFCLFNNVVVTAAVLRRAGAKVAIVDWDVHHGNGTESLVRADPGIAYVSFHQHPFYPGGGAATTVGGEGATVVNFPLPAGTGGDVYREALDRVVVPLLSRFGPDWLLVSAGFDAHEADPLAELRLVASDYGWMAGRLARLVPPERTVVFLEGGYDLEAIAASVAATVTALLGARSPDDHPPRASPPAAWDVVEAVASAVDPG